MKKKKEKNIQLAQKTTLIGYQPINKINHS